MEFYHQGAEVGYGITVLLIIGLLIALERMLVLLLLVQKSKLKLRTWTSQTATTHLVAY